MAVHPHRRAPGDAPQCPGRVSWVLNASDAAHSHPPCREQTDMEQSQKTASDDASKKLQALRPIHHRRRAFSQDREEPCEARGIKADNSYFDGRPRRRAILTPANMTMFIQAFYLALKHVSLGWMPTILQLAHDPPTDELQPAEPGSKGASTSSL